jgi:hypothetical protein
MITLTDIHVASFVMSTVAAFLITIKIARDWFKERKNEKTFRRKQTMRNIRTGRFQHDTPPRQPRDPNRPTFSDGIRNVIANGKKANASIQGQVAEKK